MHSIELVLDDDADRRVRAEWDALAAARLPSQARHKGASNRPHVTLAVTEAIDSDVDDRLRAVVRAALPLPLALGGLMIFGSRRLVLARLVIASAALLELQAAIVDVLDGLHDSRGHFAPGRWTPHVTLGRRLAVDQIGAALLALEGDGHRAEEIHGQLVGARRWDIEAKQTQSLTEQALPG